MSTDSRPQNEDAERNKDRRGNLSIELTSNQIDQVVHSANAGGHMSVLLSEQVDNQKMLELVSERLEDPRISRSLLRGLLVLSVLPAADDAIGVVDLADRLKMGTSTTHRYLATLLLVGLAERDASSRKYKRAK